MYTKKYGVTYIISSIKKSLFFEMTAEHLSKNDIDLNFILIGNYTDDFANFLNANGLRCVSIKVKTLFYYPIYLFKVIRLLRNWKPHIVHTHLVTANIIGLPAAYFSNVKVRIFTEHSGQRLLSDLKNRFIFDPLTNIFSTYAIANSLIVQEMLISRGISKSKCTVVNYGFDLKRFQFVNDSKIVELKKKYNCEFRWPIIGVISRCDERKGIQYTLEAFKSIQNLYPSALLCIFNFCESDSNFRKFKKTIDTFDGNSIMTVCFEQDIQTVYKLFTIFIHVPTSKHYESFGQIYVEALASGVPSIFTISGIANDFIAHRKNAIVVDYKNSDQIYTSVRLLLENPSLSEYLSLNGKKDVSSLFSDDVYISKLKEVYKKLINRK